jgi:hypothetical protein
MPSSPLRVLSRVVEFSECWFQVSCNSESTEPVEEISFLKKASSAGSRIGNYCLALKYFGSGNKGWSQLAKNLW